MFNQLAKLKKAVLAPTADIEDNTNQSIEQIAHTKQENQVPFDGVDLLALLFGIGALYELGVPFFLFLAVAQYFARRVRVSAEWLAEAVYGIGYKNNPEAYRLFPGAQLPVSRGLPEGLPRSSEKVANSSEQGQRSEGLPKVSERVTKSSEQGRVASSELFIARPVIQSSDNVVWTTETAINALPDLVLLDRLTVPKSTTAVPLGVNHLGEQVWADLLFDLLHVGIYGTSGAGKDTLLRVWFSTLATRNRSEDIQWAFLDGKGDWLTPDLANLTCMYFPPAGGYGQRGKEAILKAIKVVDKEAERRQSIIFPNGCRTREQYNKLAIQKGWEPLPLLIVVASDVMDSVAGEVENLLASLVSKSRALGIRVVASMQTPTGKSLEWRMNFSTVLAGALVDGTQDGPALGVREVKDLPFRPSKIPPPPRVKGVFVGKVRGEFMVLRTPIFLPDSEASEERFNQIVAGLPKKSSQVSVKPSKKSTFDERAWLLELEARYGSVKHSGLEVNGSEMEVTSTSLITSNELLPHQKDVNLTSEEVLRRKLDVIADVKRLPLEERRKLAKALQIYRQTAQITSALKQVYGISGGNTFTRLAEQIKVLDELVLRQ